MALTDGLTPKERGSLVDFLSSPMPLINHRGRAVQVDSINNRVESAFGFYA